MRERNQISTENSTQIFHNTLQKASKFRAAAQSYLVVTFVLFVGLFVWLLLAWDLFCLHISNEKEYCKEYTN